MPFLLSFILSGKSQSIQPHNVKKSCRKEGRPESSHNVDFHYYIEKASVSASRGSLTVEAAFCIPLFLLASVCLIWLLEIQVIRVSVETGMQEAGKRMAQEIYWNPVFASGKVEQELIKSIGCERLDRSLIAGGSGGVDCGKSYMHPGSKIMELYADYKIRLPIPIFHVPEISMAEHMRVKCWVGYVKEGFSDQNDRTIVYITDTGVVYHLDSKCTYLELSIRAVPAESVSGLRNESEGKYHPCERCMKHAQSAGTVFITDYGDRYHSSLSCGGLKRKIYAVPLSEVKGKGACSKCGGQ